jgi:hypothetical protein
MLATILLAVILVEGAIETFWRGAPIRWWIVIAAGCWASAMVPATLFLKWGGRLWLTTVAVVGTIIFAVWRHGPDADPGLTVLTLSLSRLLPLLVVVALLLFGAVVVRFRIAQRLPLVTAVVLLLTAYCLLPFALGAVYGTRVDAIVHGTGYWTAPPLWLQGGFLALQLIIPLGIVLAALGWLGSIAGRKGSGGAVFPAVSCTVLAAAFAVGSVELALARTPNLASRYAPDWLPRWARQSAASVAAPLPAQPASPAPASPSPAAPSTPSAGQSAGVGVPASGTQPSAAGPEPATRALEQFGRGATTRGVALTVESVEFVSDVGGRSAPPGQMFVIVRTTWQNLMALGTRGQPNTAPAPYVVPSIHGQLWLLTDNRYADPIDEGATEALDRHLPIGTLTVPSQGEAVTGHVAFRTAANASYLAMVLLDAVSGDAFVSIKGRPVDAPPPLALGSSASNDELTLTVTEAGWSENAPAAPPGLRYFTLGLRAVGRAPGRVVPIDFTGSGRLESDKQQVAEPQQVGWLKRPFARPAAILPGVPNEGQLAFLLPADAKSVKFVLRPQPGSPIDVPIPNVFGPARPER